MSDEQFTIGDSEYRDRWGKLQQKMTENNCDLLFVYSDDRAFAGAGAVRYLCDYAAHFEPAVLVMAQQGDPVLVTGPECQELAKLHSRTKVVLAVNEFALAGQAYPFAELTSITPCGFRARRSRQPARRFGPELLVETSRRRDATT